MTHIGQPRNADDGDRHEPQHDALFAVSDSHIERRLAERPLTAQAAHHAVRPLSPRIARHRPGEGPSALPDGPVDWHDMPDDTYEETWGALVDFLDWALPRWGFTSEQIPAGCWWHHPDIIEELTAWWGLWQACVRNPQANITDQSSFQERTHALKQRLEHTYRGRCRNSHQPTSVLALVRPCYPQEDELHAVTASTIASRDSSLGA